MLLNSWLPVMHSLIHSAIIYQLLINPLFLFMKLFSRITLICNISFIIFVVLRYIDFNKAKNKVDDNLIPLPFVTGTIVVLGQIAIVVNLVFCLTMVFLMVLKKIQQIPRWLVITNFMLLLIQFYYFFVY